MPKQHTINLEAVIKAALDKNSEKIIDDFEKKITEPKEINIKTDEASKQVKKLSDEIEKEQKKHTQTSRKRNKTKTATEQSTPKNADKYVQSTIYDKKGRPSTSHSYTYADGKQQSYNKNGKLTSEKQTVVDLQKAYSQLNKDVTEYYSLKTKEAKGKVATEDKQYVKGRISDLVNEMSANRKYIADAKKQGFYNNELEQKAFNHFRRKANGSNVKEINDAQIELAKVASDASESQLSQYWDQAAESAKKYGATVSDVISSTADWKRLGYSLDDAKELSDMTTLLQRVGDNMTQETSSSGLISALKGFQLEADQAQHIVDVANEVANTQPIDTAGIFEAIERSASSLKAAGNTYEQGVALASAANSVIQNPEKIGTALKTISMRIRSAETDLEEAGLDTEGMVTSTAKLRKEMLALSGVDILKDKDTFKSTYQILDELANKWSDLTDIQQADYTCLYVQKCA